MITGRLGYNVEVDRFGILKSDLWEIEGLHCGECLRVLVNDKWVDDRIEYNNRKKEWYLVETGLSGDQLEYVDVKMG